MCLCVSFSTVPRNACSQVQLGRECYAADLSFHVVALRQLVNDATLENSWSVIASIVSYGIMELRATVCVGPSVCEPDCARVAG